jgi:hypothetical protein
MPVKITCEYCKKEFSTRSNLRTHQNKAKYCLELRNIEPTVDHKCEFCENLFTTNQSLQTHILVCKVKKEKEQNAQVSELESLRKKIILLESENTKLKEEIAILKQENKKEHSLKPKPKHTIPETDYSGLEIGDGYKLVFRQEDKYVDITNLCKAGKKSFRDWNRLDKTKKFIEILSESVNLATNDLIKYQNGSNSERRTWAHPRIAINIAQWVSPEFDVQVSEWVYSIVLTGKAYLHNQRDLELIADKKTIEELNKQIKVLENKYVKKKPRTTYNEKYTVYIVTNEEREARGEYKIGKAKDLTKRLSVYNTTAEHKVVWYTECEDKEMMSVLETMIFRRLKSNRITANREWFQSNNEARDLIAEIERQKAILFQP